MKPILEFLEEEMEISNLGEEASVPDILSQLNIQNKTAFELEEDDEIYEAYGKIDTVYPYRQYTCYDRAVKQRLVKTAVLENNAIKAVFLPEFGGRLWQLIDKRTGKNLLYTNDVIRPSNLATRNAWFSGGVEWNIGIIGHTPLTMESLFTAVMEDGDGNPVLRMYEYERIRKVVYQMDFWLEEEGTFLNCRMRIVNDSAEVIPMYWWSNMAVPEYEKGRILVPAKEAYTSDFSRVYKVDIPMVDGIDISKYNEIPDQVDYFFHIPKTENKYIANLNRDGYGLLHLSTSRLQSRKLFVWGHNAGAARWQEFLTKDAGDYVEIQAGLGKTQYGCIPMAPHTAWEWVEQYGSIQVDPEITECGFAEAEKKMSRLVEKVFSMQKPEQKLLQRKEIAKQRAKLVLSGSGYADLENRCRIKQGENVLSEHLDFTSSDTRQKEWKKYLENGCLEEPDVDCRPSDFTKDDFWFEMLKISTASKDKKNWYAHYQLGLQYLYRKQLEKAEKEFKESDKLVSNPWAAHALAVCCEKNGKRAQAVDDIKRAMEERLWDLSFVKEGFRLMLQLSAYDEIIEYYMKLDENMQAEGRIKFDYIQALAGLNQTEKALDLLQEAGGLEIADTREGDVTMNKLWEALSQEPIPDRLNFRALKHEKGPRNGGRK